MSKVLIFVEQKNGQIKRSSLELLSAAQKSGHELEALCVGSQAAGVAAAVGNYGVKSLHVFKDAGFEKYNPELFEGAFAGVIEKIKPTVILASANSLGKDLFPRLAAKIKSGVASDCIELHWTSSGVKAKRPVYAGKCFAEVEFQNSPVQIVLMRANQLTIEDSSGAPAAVVEETYSAPSLKTLIKDIVAGTSEKVDLTEAHIIVSGGRGLKEAGNFKLLEDLAKVLGATVGASRAVVDAGWVPHQMQVGQTGKTVAPTLYIAVGISGAIQHLAGMSGSKVIVAINSDANAPIFQKATYGIVGDALEILPKLTEEFKKIL